ncbi:MAG: DUF3570 domain-containing protein [Rhizobacter sp.]
MAATEGRPGAVLMAAMMLPGVVPRAHAETAPESGVASVRYLSYQDEQPGLKRITVHSPSVYVMAPVDTRWSIEGSFVTDSVSGATPRYHTAISGASRMGESRHAADVKVTRYEDRRAFAAGLAVSRENDYDSVALSGEARFASEDNNRTWNVGAAYTSDRISSSDDELLHERRRTTEATVGVTQAMSAADLVQVAFTGALGRGYFSDPYKTADHRPGKRDQAILLARWNHHVEGVGGTLRASYRYYADTFRIRAHAIEAEWVQPFAGRWVITPSLRLYSQSKASFYADPVYDPVLGAPYPPGYATNPPAFFSADQRLSAFGGITAGLKLGVQLAGGWSADAKYERYEQRASWHWGGDGSPGLAPFRATFVQVGLSKRF